jgi:hypothetical protein
MDFRDQMTKAISVQRVKRRPMKLIAIELGKGLEKSRG